jgi:hypothetical protein
MSLPILLRRRRRWSLALSLILTLFGLGLLGGLVGWWLYDNDIRVRYRVDEFIGQVRDTIAPHADVLPTAAQSGALPTLAFTPLSSLALTATPSPSATSESSPTSGPTVTLTPAPPTPTPLPTQVTLTGVRHEYQKFNNCGPASLSMNLSYWGWSDGQLPIAEAVKPNAYDRNVSPRELYEYLLTQGYDAYIRVNGDVETVKRFVAAGYPVLIEKGYYCEKGERCSGWFGHYSVVTGYDDAKQVFVTQDSFRGPNLKLTYDYIEENWRAFNNLYLVVFPTGEEHDAKVQALLGEAADVDTAYRAALERAQTEAQTLTGEAAAFAWFNVGANLVYFKDYAGAAQAYDRARELGLPYRMLWYQFGPYLAYYYMARYQDVADLATFAIDGAIGEPGLEEAYYWRGLAEEALGQSDQAIEDYRTALVRHPGYQPAIDALAALGQTP